VTGREARWSASRRPGDARRWDGTVTLVPETAEVDLAAGDVGVQRGSQHAWSNRGDAPAAVALTSHAGAYRAGAR
jgi:hypothetical protein